MYFEVRVFRPYMNFIQTEMVTVESLHIFLGNKTEHLNNYHINTRYVE